MTYAEMLKELKPVTPLIIDPAIDAGGLQRYLTGWVE